MASGWTSRRGFLLACAAAVLAGRLAPQARPRDLVVAITDDQRWDAMGCAGHPFLRTPNMDRLAREGARFRNAFVTTALCSPSRASMLTGQYAHRHGVLDNETPLPPATPTYPALLQKAGYETAYVWKWHMGGAGDEPRPGWTHWASFRGQGPYFDPTFIVDGEHHGVWDLDALFDLKNDPEERRNLAALSGIKEKREELRRELLALMDRYGIRRDPSWGR